MACFLNRIKIFLLVECLLCVLLWAAVLEATHRIRHRNGKIPYFFLTFTKGKRSLKMQFMMTVSACPYVKMAYRVT